jgi:hypothetical protein
MVVHIVLFKFKEENCLAHIAQAKEMLASLQESVPTLQSIEIGENFANEERAMDLSIVTRFASKEDLEVYASHPEHLKVVAFIKEVVAYSKVVDYQQ